MKKNVTIIRFILLIGALLCFAVGMFLIKMPRASASVRIDYEDEPLQQYYTLGETFSCPQVKINADGNSLSVSKIVLYYPDGKAVSDTRYVLSNPGEYRLRYFAEYNGKTVYADDYFTVKGKAYSVSGTTSTVSYGNTGTDKGNIDGLKVSLASGDVFTYNKPLDLTDKKKVDSIISFYVIPENKGVADVKNFKLRLTDCADENNYVEAVVYANSADENEFVGDALYSGVRASIHNVYVGAHYKGYYYGEQGVYYDGNWYSIYDDVSYTSRVGYPSRAASLAASTGYGADGGNVNFSKPFSFSMNYAEKKFYGYSHGVEDTWMPSNNLIADLDDSLFFETPWNGFTTGEAYLSIYSDLYANSTFSFVILNIFDEDLTLTDYEYNKEPVIKVDLPETGVPYAIKNEPYSVFDAKAYSGCDGEIECKALVYRNYNSTSPKLCATKDGAFVPTEDTIYTIVYSAIDSYSNSVEKAIDVIVKPTREAKISLTTEGADSGYTGEEIKIKQPVAEKANGNYEITAVAVLDGEEYPIDASDDGIYSFYTLKAGTYEIKYIFVDYNGPLDPVSYNLEVTKNPAPIYYGEPILPPVFVYGVRYEFPKQDGKSFTDEGINDLTATLKYCFDDKESEDYTYGDSVEITATNKVELRYSLEEAEDKVYVIPVIDVNIYSEEETEEGVVKTVDGIDKSKYFYSAQFEGIAEKDRIKYTTQKEDAKLSFIKPVLVTDFGFEYQILNEDFSSITFTFKDAVNTANALKIVMSKLTSEKFLVSVNGSKDREITSAIKGKTHTIAYNSILNTLIIDDFDFAVEGVENFAQKNAYFDIEVNGINTTEGFGICIETINNQTMNDKTSDLAKPVCYLDITDGKKTKGDKIIINGFFIEDVLSFSAGGEISIKGPDGKFCVTTDGQTMQGVVDFTRVYEIEISAYGTYSVSYKYWDEDEEGNAGNRGTSIVKINSFNVTPPNVTVSETDKHQAVYAGKSYKIATATAKDSLGEDVKVITLIIDTEDKAHIINNSEFKFERAGIYKVMYYAEDSMGNVGFASYDIVAVD